MDGCFAVRQTSITIGLSMICRFCSLIHSDWLSCEQAQSLNEFCEPTEEVLLAAIPVLEEMAAINAEYDKQPKKRGWPKGKPRKP